MIFAVLEVWFGFKTVLKLLNCLYLYLLSYFHSAIFIFKIFSQYLCYDTVGWVIWHVKKPAVNSQEIGSEDRLRNDS